jgi:hypothetical protein
MTWIELLPLLGLGGIIGGVVGAYFQYKFQHQTQLKQYEYEVKQKRYFAINLFMLNKLDIQNGLIFMKNIRPDITTEEKLDKEIEMETLNTYLFASNDVINALIQFRKNPTYKEYYQTANAMRKDLWGKKIKFNQELNIKRD